MRQAEAAVLDKTGYAVELVEKPLYAPTPTLAVPGRGIEYPLAASARRARDK